jgi:hypothetical protein
MQLQTIVENKAPYEPHIIGGVIYGMFFLPYLGTGIPAYIVALLFLLVNITRIKFKMGDVILLGIILTWFVLKCLQSTVPSTVILLRYYFGFFIFYLFLNNLKFRLNLEKLLFWISLMIIIEAVLINTILPPHLLPNYPKNEMVDETFKTQILGFYQRPYSIGTNSSITATIVVLLLFCIEQVSRRTGLSITRKLMAISTTAVILLGSGVGYMLYLLFIIYKINPFKNIFRTVISILSILFIYFLLFIKDIGTTDGLEKISSLYIGFLYDFKIAQIQDMIDAFKGEPSFWLIGQKFNDPKELIIWSDFAWENLLYCTGVIGLFATVITFLFKANKHNLIPLIIFVVGAIHYGAMYSLPGQLLLGFLFTRAYKTLVIEKIKVSNVAVAAI